MHRPSLVASAAALVILGWFALAPVAVLEVIDLTSGTTLAEWTLEEGREFTISFTHSMYGAEVRERYRAGQNGLMERLEVATGSAAAAEYYAYTSPVTQREGRYVLSLPTLELREVVIRVDEVGRPVLTIGDSRLPLLEYAGDGHQVSIRVTSRARMAMLRALVR
ncbi:MAG: DUF1850 domain-containing protein [Chloroflexota bacterium]